jgi:hypothetical protein
LRSLQPTTSPLLYHSSESTSLGTWDLTRYTPMHAEGSSGILALPQPNLPPPLNANSDSDSEPHNNNGPLSLPF